MERQYGSLIRGALATRRNLYIPDRPNLISFKTGTHELIDALVEQLTSSLRLNTTVQSVTKVGQRFGVKLDNGEQVNADAVILATPAKSAAGILRDIASQAAAELCSIDYSSIGAVYLAFRRADVEHPLDGFGTVIPRTENRAIDVMTWVTSKWNLRAPANTVLLRVFFGGPKTRTMMGLDDSRLVYVIRSEVKSLLGIQAGPIFHHVFRWPEGCPQYNLGHLDRVKAIESALPGGLYVTGSSYRGIGVPDCITQGQHVALQTITYLTKNDRRFPRKLASGAT